MQLTVTWFPALTQFELKQLKEVASTEDRRPIEAAKLKAKGGKGRQVINGSNEELTQFSGEITGPQDAKLRVSEYVETVVQLELPPAGQNRNGRPLAVH